LTYNKTVILSGASCSFIARGAVEGPAMRIVPAGIFSLLSNTPGLLRLDYMSIRPSVVNQKLVARLQGQRPDTYQPVPKAQLRDAGNKEG
jgi:hypothetical protein